MLEGCWRGVRGVLELSNNLFPGELNLTGAKWQVSLKVLKFRGSDEVIVNRLITKAKLRNAMRSHT